MCFFFFFFKQKTAYEIGTGDWSSDVCSSDLIKCMDGHLKAGSPSFIAKCNQNGTWEGDPRCIAIGDSQLMDMKGLLYMENTISVYSLPLQVGDVTFVYKIELLYNVFLI